MDQFLGYLVTAMDWLNINIFNDFGVTVIAFTLAIKLITLPFDIKQRRSMQKTAEHSAEIAKLQKRYQSDPQILQKKTSEYYKKVGVSPYASCLPMIFTLVFFMLFLNAMRVWANLETVRLYLEPTLENITSCKWMWVNNIWQPDSGFKQVIMDYAAFSKLNFEQLSFALDSETINSLKGITEAQYIEQMRPLIDHFELELGIRNGWFVMPVLSTLTSLLTSWISQKFQPQTAASPQADQTQSMNRTMMMIMPIMSFVICLQNNTAFAIYWVASNIISTIVTCSLNASKIKDMFKKEKNKETLENA